MLYRTLTFFALMLLLFVGRAGADPASAPVNSVPPTKPTLLRDDPLLKEKVTLEATDRPLGDVLKELSPRLGVDLTASSQVADQRVTLRLTDQPLYLLMNRLPALLSHLPDRPHGYYWERLDRPAKSRPAFNLWRDLRSVQDEEYERDYPRREARVLLRDLRNLAQLTPKERAAYKGDYRDRLDNDFDGLPFIKALRGLADDQLDALATGQALPLDPVVFAEEITTARQAAAGTQQMLTGFFAERKKAIAAGQPDPHPGIRLPSDMPSVAPVLRLTPIDEDENTGWFGAYNLSMEGVQPTSSIVLDTYDTNSNPALYRRPPAPKPSQAQDIQGQTIDLTPLLSAKTVTPLQRGDIGFTLQALARTAHLSIYQEDFLRESLMDSYSDPNAHSRPPAGLALLKGTLPTLIAAICAHWDYRWQKVGDDYLFWSRTWALDRANDVPERLIAPWRQRLKKQGALTLEDRTEIATTLPLRLIKLTLDQTLPEAGPWSSTSYRLFRFLGHLSPEDKDAALSSVGLSLGSASLQTQEAVLNDFEDWMDFPNEQLNRVVITLQMEDDPKLPTQRVTLNAKSDGLSLFDLQATVPVPSIPPPSAPDAKPDTSLPPAAPLPP